MKQIYFFKLFFIGAMLFGSSMFAQTITGIVSDSNGPMPGVNVIVKGTSFFGIRREKSLITGETAGLPANHPVVPGDIEVVGAYASLAKILSASARSCSSEILQATSRVSLDRA